MKVFRGNLQLPDDATPGDHTRVRKEFLRIVNRWRLAKGYTVEMHGVLHITDPLNGHWDTALYSDAPVKPLRAAISEAWARAGGRSQSLVPLPSEDILAASKYQVKDTLRPEKAPRYLPASQSEMGSNITWSTRRTSTSKGFWQGQSEAGMWSELVAEYVSGLGSCPILVRDFRAKMVERLRRQTPDAEAYLTGFAWHTPTTKSGAAGSEVLTNQEVTI